MAVGQEASGTINSITLNPTVNMELTGNMPTVTGQPNDYTIGGQTESGLVPVTTSMTGSGSNGNMTQAPTAEAANKTTAQATATAKPAAAAAQRKPAAATSPAKSAPAKQK